VLFVRSIGTSFHNPAISAVTPLIVPESHLIKCAGYTQTVQTFGYIAGTAVAAVLYPLWGVTGMVILDVAGAILASLSVAAVKIPEPERQEQEPQQEKSQGLMYEVKEGYKLFKGSKGLFALLWIGAVFSILFSPVNALFPLMSFDYFGGTTTHASIVEITFASGMRLGGVLLGVWGGFKNRAATMTISMALIGVSIAFTGILPTGGFIVFAVLSFFMGFAAPFYTGIQTALMQERFAPEYLGRIFGVYGSIASCAMLLGLVITGILADMTGITLWFFISGLMTCVLALVMFLMPSVRNIEQEKD
jgi:DHA3 family macrolide efflux protein-like MFS transporter